MKNNKRPTQQKFTSVFLAVSAVHILIATAFIGSTAYGESGHYKQGNTEAGVANAIPIEQKVVAEQQSAIVQPAIIKKESATPQEVGKNQPPTESSKPQTLPTNKLNDTTARTNNTPTKTNKSEPGKNTKPKANHIQKYTVKPNDTIYSISKKYKLNVKKLIELNKIKDSSKIVAGQTLKFE